MKTRQKTLNTIAWSTELKLFALKKSKISSNLNTYSGKHLKYLSNYRGIFMASSVNRVVEFLVLGVS